MIVSEDELRKAARLYVKSRNTVLVSTQMGHAPDWLDSVLEDPDTEEWFNEEVARLANRLAKRLVTAYIPTAIAHLGAVVADGGLEDGRSAVSAAKALVELWMKLESGDGDEDELSKLFKEIQAQNT